MMKKTSSLSIIVALLVLSACATTDPSIEKAQYSMVDASTAKTLHEGDAVFIDVRIKSIFNEGHIPDAINIPINHFNGNTLAEAVNKDQAIVIYCYGIHCDYSNQASSKALTWGYRKVYYFMKGYPAWLDAGYPTES
ncbi:MAG: rhodanese-like domain-containing protein [Gammaproteobacteria bacterium]|nr:rhodanese-like domain-containing protein [Gammaproteobacteria bacterium]